MRDWLYVRDNCEAVDLVFRKGKVGEVYNIGGENEKENIDITKMILKELDKAEDLIEFVKDRLGHDRRYSLDGSKTKKLGWKPKVKVEEGLKITVDWYKKNQDWWKKIK